MSDDYRQLFRKVILDADDFVEASFSGPRQDGRLAWHKVTLRPVLIRNIKQIQFSYFDAEKNITKNHAGSEIQGPLEELLALPYRNLQLKRAGEQIRVQISKKGRAIIHRDRNVRQMNAGLEHDRKKRYLLSPETDPFLHATGITTADGKVKAKMQRKFRQINQFLKLIDETARLDSSMDRPVRVLDFGCGSAHLTFATYHYLSHVLQLPTQLVGVDIKDQLLEVHAQTAQRLGWEGISFQAMKIIDYLPDDAPDIVLALHACDTATDEALAQGIKSSTRYIFCAPCCHHHLQQQLNRKSAPTPFPAIRRHGILSERMGDILTDAFRALLLGMAGYKTDVVEFISTEHTPRNLMIRASRINGSADSRLAGEYQKMKDFWGVVPYLEDLVRPYLEGLIEEELVL